MDLVSLVVVLIVIGLVIYLVRILPIDQTFRTIIICVLILIVILWLLGQMGGIPHFYVGRRP